MNMMMFVAVALIWGSGAINVKWQLGVVDPMISVIYRFFGAALILLLYCRIKGLSLQFTPMQHGFIVLQGVCNFALPYLFFYTAQQSLTSGLAAVIFSLLVIMNALNAALFLRQGLRFYVLFAAGTGLTGMILLFYPEITSVQMTGRTVPAILLGLAGVFAFSAGNMVASGNRKRGLPVVQTTALGMLYATLLTAVPALLTRTPFLFDGSLRYVGSLIYLILGSSVTGYLCYLTLLDRIGPGRTAFITLLAPLVAMGWSTWLEGYHWHWSGVIGLTLILGGNLIAMRDKLHFRTG